MLRAYSQFFIQETLQVLIGDHTAYQGRSAACKASALYAVLSPLPLKYRFKNKINKQTKTSFTRNSVAGLQPLFISLTLEFLRVHSLHNSSGKENLPKVNWESEEKEFITAQWKLTFIVQCPVLDWKE